MVSAAYRSPTAHDPREMLRELAGEPEKALALFEELADILDRLSVGMERGDLALAISLFHGVALQTLEAEAHGGSATCGAPGAPLELQLRLTHALMSPDLHCCVFTRLAAAATVASAFIRRVAVMEKREGGQS